MYSMIAVAHFRRAMTRTETTRALLCRCQSTSPTPPPSSSENTASTSSMIQQLLTFAAAGGIAYTAYHYIGKLSIGMENTAGDDTRRQDGPVPPQANVTSRVYLDIQIEELDAGRIVLGLFGTVAPKTCRNFETLCHNKNATAPDTMMTFRNTPLHRIITNFMIQGGDTTRGDGTGGRSIYGRHFDDENFQLKHIGPGILAMANAGRNTNGSQFYITTKRTPHLDGRHVVFGTVLEGWDVVKRIESFGNRSGVPQKRIVIRDCGVLEDADDVGDEVEKTETAHGRSSSR